MTIIVDQKNVAICVATYKRPEGIKALLDSIALMDYDMGKLHIFIADNDAKGQAGFDFINKNKADYPFDVSCETEESAGISFARNKTLDMAKNSGKTFDFCAFTDDDIIVSQNWIKDLVRAADLHDADIVFGKREPLFENRPSKETLASPFFYDDFSCPPTGTRVNAGGTNNAFLRAEIFEKEGWEAFDPELALTGGEDVDFFTKIRLKGYKFIRCASAVVYEVIPDSRNNEKWFVNRYFRSGSSYAYVVNKHFGGKKTAIELIKKMIKLPILFLKYKKEPTLKNKCHLYNNLGFFYFFKNKKPFQEYKDA